MRPRSLAASNLRMLLYTLCFLLDSSLWQARKPEQYINFDRGSASFTGSTKGKKGCSMLCYSKKCMPTFYVRSPFGLNYMKLLYFMR